MNKSAFFIILLIASFTQSQKHVLEMLDKTVVGKKVLDNIFVQVKLLGNHLQSDQVHQILDSVTEKANGLYQAAGEQLAENNQFCQESTAGLGQAIASNIDRQGKIQNKLEDSKRHLSRKQLVVERATEEAQNYQQFADFFTSLKNDWATNYENVINYLKNDLELLNQISNTVDQAGNSNAAFVQKNMKYKTSLTQIKVQFQSRGNDLTGMKPILSNLVQIMQGDAVNDAQVKIHIQEVVAQLRITIRDRIDEVEEQNEVVKNQLESLETALQGNVKRTNDFTAEAQKGQTFAENKVNHVAKLNDAATSLLTKLKNIISLRVEACEHFAQVHSYENVNGEKVLDVIQQVKNILNENFNVLPAFFAEKERKLSHK